jgi:hypothetical protein
LKRLIAEYLLRKLLEEKITDEKNVDLNAYKTSRQHNINDLLSPNIPRVGAIKRIIMNDNMASEGEKILLKLFINSSVSRSKVDK